MSIKIAVKICKSAQQKQRKEERRQFSEMMNLYMVLIMQERKCVSRRSDNSVDPAHFEILPQTNERGAQSPFWKCQEFLKDYSAS